MATILFRSQRVKAFVQYNVSKSTVNGFVQDCSISIAMAPEILQ